MGKFAEVWLKAFSVFLSWVRWKYSGYFLRFDISDRYDISRNRNYFI